MDAGRLAANVSASPPPGLQEASKKNSKEELEAELLRGQKAIYALLEHLMAMNCDAVTIEQPISDGSVFRVEVNRIRKS